MDYILQTKSHMNTQELQLFEGELNKRKKSAIVLWLLWFFTGGIGGHRYYLKNYVYAIFMTLTLGFFGIWALIDAFFIMKRLKNINEETEREIIKDIASLRSIKSNF